jgi:nucleotide-binding universal stress UspA family protein
MSLQNAQPFPKTERRARAADAGGLVVGIDGSPESIAALNSAAAIAVARGCPVHIVSVLPPFASYHTESTLDQSQSEVEALRINIREVLIREVFEKANPDNRWTHEVVTGKPARLIADIGRQRKAEMIVVGRSHHGAIDRILGGETSLQIIRRSSVPVLTVETDLKEPRTVVAAVDFSEASLTAAKRGLEMVRPGGVLYLVYVEPPVDLLPAGFALAADARYPGDVVCWFRRMTGELGQRTGVRIEPVVLNGKPVKAILEFSDRVGADLIVAGTHGPTPIERWIVGSVSTGLVRNAQCPVLTAPPADSTLA